MGNFFSNLFENVRLKKGYFITLVLLSVVVIILAVVSAIQLNGSILPIDLSNIVFIRFLRGNCGFMFLIIDSILNLLIFYLAIVGCCCKSFLRPVAILFYLYFVYCQAMIFTSIILIYGLLNAFLILVLLLIYLLCIFTLLMMIILCLFNVSCDGFWATCFRPSECQLVFLSLAILLLTIAFCIIEFILKSFVLLLVF